ncbi:MAG: NirD/YgiW/YdeI family stress tolerance protein [Spirochaetaceae bacterium]|nr:NirD/YgiW/YdeI family stress tolerance protein [Spirochaetaceae bacterium]
MKKIILLSLFMFLIIGCALDNGPHQSTTVAQASVMREGSRVSLIGVIVHHIDDDYYLFSDRSGEIRVEIEARRWNGLQVVGTGDLIEIRGEVDRTFFGRLYIYVTGVSLVPLNENTGLLP